MAEAFESVCHPLARDQRDVTFHRMAAPQDNQAGQSYPFLPPPGARRGGCGGARGAPHAPLQVAPELHPLPDHLREALDAPPDLLGLNEREVEAHAVLACSARVEALTRHISDVLGYCPREHSR